MRIRGFSLLVAVAAALGSASEALAVGSASDAAAAVRRLREEDAGQVYLVVGSTAAAVDRSGWPELPSGATWAADVVTAPEAVADAIAVSQMDAVPLPQAREELEFFFGQLMARNPGLLGGKLPAAAFYAPG